MSQDKILVSKCLLGVKCKYSGGDNYNMRVIKFLADKTVIPVCPEEDGGLAAPREPAEIRLTEIGARVLTVSGNDVTPAFETGAHMALKAAKENGCTLAILKERSPSCGVNEVYDGTFTGKAICGSGITASLLKENGIRVMSEEEI